MSRTRFAITMGILMLAGLQAQAQSRPDAGRAARSRRPRPSPAVRTDAGVRPPTHGRIDPALVQPVLRGQATALRGCYESALRRDPLLHGEVTVRLRVEEDGSVSATSSGGDPALSRVGACMEDVLRRVRFPRPTGGAATVAAPFRFSAGE